MCYHCATMAPNSRPGSCRSYCCSESYLTSPLCVCFIFPYLWCRGEGLCADVLLDLLDCSLNLLKINYSVLTMWVTSSLLFLSDMLVGEIIIPGACVIITSHCVLSCRCTVTTFVA